MDATVELRGVRTGGAEPVRACGPRVLSAAGACGVLRRAVTGAGVVLASAATVVGLGLLADLAAAGQLPVPLAAVSAGR